MNEEQKNIEPVNPMETLVRATLVGSLAALCPNKPADSKASEVSQYMEMMQDKKNYFHNITYIGQCIALMRGIPNLFMKDTPHFIAAILFHKVFFDPRKGSLSIRKSCEIAAGYYPGDKTVTLFSLIKATRFSALIRNRYKDDRAYIADIAIHMYGLPWNDFRKIWGLILQEFEVSGCKPTQFKKLTTKQLRNMLSRAEKFGLFQTCYFRQKFEEQAIANINQLISEISE